MSRESRLFGFVQQWRNSWLTPPPAPVSWDPVQIVGGYLEYGGGGGDGGGERERFYQLRFKTVLFGPTVHRARLGSLNLSQASGWRRRRRWRRDDRLRRFSGDWVQ